MEDRSEREARLLALARQLQFTVRKSGDRFTLTRTAEVSRPVSERGLSLQEAEDLLQTWKLRGFHGGQACGVAIGDDAFARTSCAADLYQQVGF